MLKHVHELVAKWHARPATVADEGDQNKMAQLFAREQDARAVQLQEPLLHMQGRSWLGSDFLILRRTCVRNSAQYYIQMTTHTHVKKNNVSDLKVFNNISHCEADEERS